MSKVEGIRGRSALSDITPSPGPGPIQNAQERDSLYRCAGAVQSLFGSPRSKLSRFDQNEVAQHLRPDVLAEIVRWYWYNDRYERRTKGSDLKRELKKVVTHLASLKTAMAAVPAETRRALNRQIISPTREKPELRDAFGEAERLNNLLLEVCRPLVAPKYTKQASISVTRAGEALAAIWEAISHKPLDRNTKSDKAGLQTVLVTDKFIFESDGMYFIHVLLQAIDPAITRSMVQSNMRRAAARVPRNQ